MGFAASGSGGVKAAINVTPLVDVVLVLLIIFMVVTPLLQRGKDVHLPKATTSEADEKKDDPLVVSITLDKQLWLETKNYDDAELTTKVGESLKKTPGRKILLKGDEKLTFGDVRRVMDRLRTSGAKGVGLGVEEIKK
jgi:biopolymer transport protein TolR